MFVRNILPAIQDMMVDIDFYLPGSGRNIYSSGWYPAGELQGLFFYFYFYGIIVALPFGVSYCLDRKRGYMKNICNRVSKNKYVVMFAIGAVYFAYRDIK